MELYSLAPGLYRVKKGQSLSDISKHFHLPPRVLAVVNGLSEEPKEGRVLVIPKISGNLYVVRGGESMTLLCGSREKFIEKNMTEHLYPGQMILI